RSYATFTIFPYTTLFRSFLFLIRCQVFIQGFPIHWIEFQLLQPGNMLDRPFCPTILISMPKNKRMDLLLQFFKCELVVISHPKIDRKSTRLNSSHVSISY